MSAERGGVGPLGAFLAQWGAGKVPETPAALGRCGGAYLRLNRAEVQRMQERGVRLVEDPERVIPAEGRGQIRVKCGRELMTRVVREDITDEETGEVRETFRRPVTYGLCARCSGWEMAIRQRLKQEAEQAAQAPSTKRRGFREAAE